MHHSRFVHPETAEEVIAQRGTSLLEFLRAEFERFLRCGRIGLGSECVKCTTRASESLSVRPPFAFPMPFELVFLAPDPRSVQLNAPGTYPRPAHATSRLSAIRDGQPYITDGARASAWQSLWQRLIARVLRETPVVERFTEHDPRAKCASDAGSLEHARALLAHAGSATTRRIYRRRPERVKPLR